MAVETVVFNSGIPQTADEVEVFDSGELVGGVLPPVVSEPTDQCTIQCGSVCEWIFSKVSVWPLIRGGTRVEWTLHPRFADPTPHVFQLQVGRTGNPNADDWEDVGFSVQDTFFAIDDTKRVYGNFQWTHYRIVLTTSQGSYASKPQLVLDNLSKRDWLRMREIIRMETLRFKKEAGVEGYLLKRRLFGEECECIDTLTKEVRNAQCAICYGTGYVGGYYPPVPCYYFEEVEEGGGKVFDNQLDNAEGRGTIDDSRRIIARVLNTPQVFAYDVIVDKGGDTRWVVRSAEGAVAIRGLPIVLKAELRLLPYSHPIYNLEIEGQN